MELSEITSVIARELGTIVVGALGAAALAFLEAARRLIVSYMERQAIIGAVQRAAGLALENEKQGMPHHVAIFGAVEYVAEAVPKALEAQGTMPHLGKMVEGAVGVLRASGR